MNTERTYDRSHDDFLLLLAVTGTDSRQIESIAQQVHDEYMTQFGPLGAMTIGFLKCDRLREATANAAHAPQWTHIIRYFGPVQSVRWLQDHIAAAITRAGGTAIMQTFDVTDVTGRY